MKSRFKILGLIIVLSGCSPEEDRSVYLIHQELERRQETYLRSKMEECRSELEAEAKRKALSRVREEFRMLNDTAFRLPRFHSKPKLNMRKVESVPPNEPLFDTL